jgi:hypothetical protein
MKRITILGMFLCLTTIFVSCSKGVDSIEINVEEVNINGDSEEYIQVVPGKYEIKKVKGALDNDELQISLKFKVIKSFDSNKIDENTGIGNLSLQVLDESDTPIDLDFSPAGVADWDKIKSLLKSKPGEVVTVLFKPSGFSNDEAVSEILNKAKGIEITRADITNPKSDDVAVEDLSIDEGTGDCEQFCSDYEEFADEYVAFMKKYKSNPSDPSILSEYSDMISKAAEMQESSTDCSADVNVAARISKALARIAKAAI